MVVHTFPCLSDGYHTPGGGILATFIELIHTLASGRICVHRGQPVPMRPD
jgi:hypothetical protein